MRDCWYQRWSNKPQISTRVDCFWIKTKICKLNTFKTYLKELIFSTTDIYVRRLPKGHEPTFWFALPADQLLICSHLKQSTSIRYLCNKLNVLLSERITKGKNRKKLKPENHDKSGIKKHIEKQFKSHWKGLEKPLWYYANSVNNHLLWIENTRGESCNIK